MQAVVHYRLASAMGLAFQQMDGTSFPMNDVRLSEFLEVRNQQKKDAEIEQKQEQARRGDPVAAAVVGSHEYREERDLYKAARLFQAAADKGDDWGLNNLGSMLLNGLGGMEADHKLAVECFNRSALLVNPWGMVCEGGGDDRAEHGKGGGGGGVRGRGFSGQGGSAWAEGVVKTHVGERGEGGERDALTRPRPSPSGLGTHRAMCAVTRILTPVRWHVRTRQHLPRVHAVQSGNLLSVRLRRACQSHGSLPVA